MRREEAVRSDDVVAILLKSLGDIRTDEPGAAGHENPHAITSMARSLAS
jgi:hypothetical protein